jgi:hypothetical protein
MGTQMNRIVVAVVNDGKYTMQSRYGVNRCCPKKCPPCSMVTLSQTTIFPKNLSTSSL